jgi:hypothetical protein
MNRTTRVVVALIAAARVAYAVPAQRTLAGDGFGLGGCDFGCGRC